MKIREIETYELAHALELIWASFLEFVASDYSDECINKFSEFLMNKDIDLKHKFFGAFNEDSIVGVISTNNELTHITSFFIHKDYLNQNIREELWEYVKNKSKAKSITVYSNPSGVDIYKDLNFEVLDYEKVIDGINLIYMVYENNK